MKSLALTLLSINSIFAVTVQAQQLTIGSGAPPTVALGQPGTSLTLIGGGNIFISSGGTVNFGAGSPSGAGGTISLVSSSRPGVAPINSTGGNISLQNPGAIGTTSRGTISLMPSTPAITSRGTITVTSAPPAQTAQQSRPQSAVPMAMPVAPAGNLVNGTVTVRMPLVKASTITLR